MRAESPRGGGSRHRAGDDASAELDPLRGAQKRRALERHEADMDKASKRVDTIACDTVIEASELKRSTSGTLRAKTKDGWVTAVTMAPAAGAGASVEKVPVLDGVLDVLRTLKLSQLLQRARDSGATQETLDLLMDTDDPRASVLALLESALLPPQNQVGAENLAENKDRQVAEEAVPPPRLPGTYSAGNVETEPLVHNELLVRQNHQNQPAMVCADDASGTGPIGAPRSLVDANGRTCSAVLEDRGVRGAWMGCRWDGEAAKHIELPLAFAAIELEHATVIITVHEGVHPDSEHKGERMRFVCPGGKLEAKAWQHEIELAVQRTSSNHWGVSKNFIREQFDNWNAERTRYGKMLVVDYFQKIGLRHVYDETWQWCAGVLEHLEAKQVKTTAELKDIAYCSRKMAKHGNHPAVGKYTYEDMELTDYMNILKYKHLAPANKQISYADFIAAETDSSGRRKVAKATVFVSHVWKMSAKDFFEVCLAEMGEDDYAWIDLYLHNQYQGAVSTIGDENSQYWVNKFSELIGGIGKVIAIVTEWECPTMLTRIWCLFELHAAIDSGAELKFVASAKEKLGFSLQLNDTFKNLDAIVSNIEVRNCDAKRPHEVQDKRIFLTKLAGMEDDVNARLRRAMQRWLADAASVVLRRCDPRRGPMGPEELEIEIADIGAGGLCVPSCVMRPGYGGDPNTVECRWGPTGARVTELLELYPRLSWSSVAFWMIGWFCLSLMLISLVYDAAESSEGSGSDIAYGSGSGSTDFGANVDDSIGSMEMAMLGSLVIIALVALVCRICFDPCRLYRHQKERQLRQPQYFCRGPYGRVTLITVVYCTGIGLSLVVSLIVHSFGMVQIWGLIMATIAVPVVQDMYSSWGCDRAQLAVNVGWLRMRMGDVEAAEGAFRAGHDELQRARGPNDPASYLAAPGLVYSLCKRKWHPPLRDFAVEATQLVNHVQHLAIHSDSKTWRQHGHMLRARMAAASGAADAEVLTLLSEASRVVDDYAADVLRLYALVSTENPEFSEFLNRMSPDGDGTAEDRALWQALHPVMRSAGRNPASPWIKYTHDGRSYYQRDEVTRRDDPSMSTADEQAQFNQALDSCLYFAHPLRNTTLLEPPEGVRREVEIGVVRLTHLDHLGHGHSIVTTERWEYEYARLGGPGCWDTNQVRRYEHKRTAMKVCVWFLLPCCICAALLIWSLAYAPDAPSLTAGSSSS